MTTVYPPRPLHLQPGMFDAEEFFIDFMRLDAALADKKVLSTQQRTTLIASLCSPKLRDLLLEHIVSYTPEMWESVAEEAAQFDYRAAGEAYTLAIIAHAIHSPSSDRDGLVYMALGYRKHFDTTFLTSLLKHCNPFGNTSLLNLMDRRSAASRRDYGNVVDLGTYEVGRWLRRA